MCSGRSTAASISWPVRARSRRPRCEHASRTTTSRSCVGCKTDGNGTNDVRVSQVTDATDVPTAELASLIAPCLVLAEDKSLRRPGYAPSA